MCKGGSIPSSLCELTLLSLNVENNNIDCYDGCLTTAHMSVTGATSICPDNNKIYLFLTISSCFIMVGIICTMYYSSYHSTYEVKYKYNYYSAYVSFAKLIVVIFLVLWIDDYWYYCANNSTDMIETCTSAEYNNCNSYCDDVTTTLVTTNDDIFMFHYSTGGYCTARFDGNCACKYWQRFMLLPLFMHLMHFILQTICFVCFYQLDPQQIHYNIINKYLTMEVGSAYEWWSEVLRELCQQPYYSGFAFIEIITMVYVWLELWFTPVHCGGHIRLSQVYFPLFMTLLDISKYNIYMSFKHIRNNQWGASVTALFNLRFLGVYFLLTVVLGGVYACTVTMDGCKRLYNDWWRLCRYIKNEEEEVGVGEEEVMDAHGGINKNNRSTQPLLRSLSEGADDSLNSMDVKL